MHRSELFKSSYEFFSSSTQDALFTGSLSPRLIKCFEEFLPDELHIRGSFIQQYSHCPIEGSYGLMFGCAAAAFDNCEIRSVYDVREIGHVAAPAHTEDQTSGLYFINYHFACKPTVPSHSVYLARPWRDYGITIFDHCQYGPHIAPEGFDKWEDTGQDKTARFYETLDIDGRVPEDKRTIEQRIIAAIKAYPVGTEFTTRATPTEGKNCRNLLEDAGVSAKQFAKVKEKSQYLKDLLRPMFITKGYYVKR